MEAGFASDCAKSVATACETAKSGQFQVVVSIPQLRMDRGDDSPKSLITTIFALRLLYGAQL